MRVFLITTLISFLFSFTVYAESFSKSYSYQDYDQAEKAKSFISFHMSSTKLGFITTDFKGYVKKFKITADKKEKTFNNAKVIFNVQDMDTDVGARNDKMFEECFGYKSWPIITVSFSSPFSFDQKEFKNTKALINVRGKELPITINLKKYQEGKKTIVEGTSEVTLTGLKIPDPSIIIASVADSVKIIFKVVVD